MLPENHSVPESTVESQEETNTQAQPSLEELASMYSVEGNNKALESVSTVRSSRIEKLKSLVKNLEERNKSLESKDVARDERARLSILLRSMTETDSLYEKAKLRFGRGLTVEEEEVMKTTLDYVLRRVITQEIQKTGQAELALHPDQYLETEKTGVLSVLPGGPDMFVGHDLSHVLLSLKLGTLNENSPLPTFMRDKTDFNSDKQAMLEEAFATLFTPEILGADDKAGYDIIIQNPGLLTAETASLYNEQLTPFYRGLTEGKDPHFTNLALAQEAKSAIGTFIETNAGKLNAVEPINTLALYSQGGGFAESLDSSKFKLLSEEEKLVFIKNQLAIAQGNIDVLISGEVPAGADEKYKQTVALTRETLSTSLESVKENPKKSVFVDMLLENLRPLHQKAQAQAQASFKRSAGSIEATQE